MGLVKAYNNNYIEQAKRITNRPNTVKVLVEDDVDVLFWNCLLNPNSKGVKFKIVAYVESENKKVNIIRGKDHILQKHCLGKSLIACVDSDYDYLVPSVSQNAQIMSTNPYILQTYTYAIENYVTNPFCLPPFCVDLTAEQTEFDFNSFFEEFSKIIYPLLLWSLFLEKIDKRRRKKNFPRLEFQNILNFKRNISPQNILFSLKDNVDKKIQKLEKSFPGYCADIKFQTRLMKCKGVESTNAYLFIPGHSLMNLVVNNLLCPIVKDLRNKHVKNFVVKHTDTEKERNDKINRKKQYENNFNFNKMKESDYIKRELEKNKEFRQYPHPIYDKMRQSIEKLLDILSSDQPI